MSDADTAENSLTSLAAHIVSAYVSRHVLPAGELPNVIKQVHLALDGLTEKTEAPPAAEKPVPAVTIRKSVQDDYLICLEDGQKFKSLKRHLMTHYGMTADDYRAKWELPASYPMVAPSHSERRSELAKANRLGQTRKSADMTPARGDAVPAVVESGSNKTRRQNAGTKSSPRTKRKPAADAAE